MNPSEIRITLQLRGKEIELPTGESTIGRSRGCTVTLKDTSVSRNHAVIEVSRGIARLTDLGSSNGTYVNGQRLHGSVELADGDRVTIGETDLRFYRHIADEMAETVKVDDEEPGQTAAASPASGPAPASAAAAFWSEEVAEPTPPASPAPAPPLPPPPRVVAPPAPIAAPSPPAASPLSPPPTRPPGVPPAPPPSPPAGAASAAPQPAPPAPTTAARTESAGDQELLPSIDELDLAALPPAPGAADSRTSRDGSRASRGASPAGFWIRFAALVVDSVIILLVSFGTAFLFGGPFSSRGSFVLSLVYGLLGLLVPLFGWGLFGTTPGKRLFNLYVVTLDGRAPIGIGRALLRILAYLLSILSLGIGFLMIGVTAAKRGLHDLIAGTVVVRR